MSERIKVGDRVRHQDADYADFPAVVLWMDELDVLIEFEKSKERQLWPLHKTVLCPKTVTFKATLTLEEAKDLDVFWSFNSRMGPDSWRKICRSLEKALKEAGPQ